MTTNTTMPFGKHKGKTIKEVFDKDPSYYNWLNGVDLKGAIGGEYKAVYDKCGKAYVPSYSNYSNGGYDDPMYEHGSMHEGCWGF